MAEPRPQPRARAPHHAGSGSHGLGTGPLNGCACRTQVQMPEVVSSKSHTPQGLGTQTDPQRMENLGVAPSDAIQEACVSGRSQGSRPQGFR